MGVGRLLYEVYVVMIHEFNGSIMRYFGFISKSNRFYSLRAECVQWPRILLCASELVWPSSLPASRPFVHVTGLFYGRIDTYCS